MSKFGTQEQRELLILICPGPIGEGRSMKEASEILGVCVSALDDRLQRFKRKFPMAWGQIRAIQNTVRRHHRSLDNCVSFMNWDDEKVERKW